MNAKQSKATTSNNKRYSLLIALFCLCVMAYGQMFKVSKPAKKLDHTTTATEWPTGMVWQNLAVDDNGTKRYWRYNALEEAIVLQETKGNTPDEEWAFVEQSPQTYFIYNRAAGPTSLLITTRLPSTASAAEVIASRHPQVIPSSTIIKLLTTQDPTLYRINILYQFTRSENNNGFYINPISFNYPGVADYGLQLRLSAKEEGGKYQLHTTLHTETSNTLIISEEPDRPEERYRDSILARLKAIMPIIKQAATQTTQSKDGVVGSWLPQARTELKAHYDAYVADSNKVDKAVDKAKALVDYYLQAIKDGKYMTVQSGRVYRIVNVWDQFGSYSLTLDPTTDKFLMAPTNPNDLRQHFIFFKHVDGHYIGSPYTGKFMAMPKYLFQHDGFEMRSLNTHVKFERRAYGGYERIGSLTPYNGDATIQQIRVLSLPLLPNDIGYLEPNITNNLAGHPTGFAETFRWGNYDPEEHPQGGWYIHPVSENDVPISTEAFTDLIRGANITATAGRLFAPTVNAATAAIAAYKNAIASFPPTASALARLHTEVTIDKLKAMPWIAPRPNISFRLLNWGLGKTFSPHLITSVDYKVEAYKDNYDLQMDNSYNEVHSYNSFAFVPHESQPNKYKLWQVQRDRYLVINEQGYPGLSANKNTPPVALTIKPYYEDSTQVGFTMQIEDGRYVSAVFETRQVYSNQVQTEYLKFTPELKNEPTFSSVWSCDTSIIDVAYIDDLGYTTFSSSRAATLPNELTAHKVTAFEQTTNTLAVKPVTESIIPANTGVLLKGTSGPYWLEDAIASGNVAAYADNLLKPNVAPTLLPGPVYMLSGTSPADVGFYRSRTNILFPAKRAYLPQSVIFTGAPALRLVEADIISNISTVHDTNTAKPQVYYDLQGRRVEKPTKGIYIVNGQKVAF